MKRLKVWQLVCIFVFLFAFPVFAITFKDVPDNHYARDAVYELVNRGITTGYPDGTFRGTEKLNRYDTAVFLSKLAQSIEKNRLSENDIKQLIRQELAKNQPAPAQPSNSGWKFAGDYTIRGLLNNLFASGARSVLGQHRLRLRVGKDLGSDIYVDAGMDTRTYANDYLPLSNLDIFQGGFFDWGARANLAVFEVPWEVEISQGNGDQYHKETRVQVLTDLWGINVGGAYEFNQGLIANPSNQYSLVAGAITDLPWLGVTTFNGSFDLFVATSEVNPLSGNSTKMVQLAMQSVPEDGIKLGLKAGLHGNNTSGMFVAGMFTLEDYWATGTNFYAEIYKLGSDWQASLGEDFVGVKVFEENVVTGNENSYVGLVVDQVLDDQWSFLGRLAFNFTGAGMGALQSTIIEPKFILQTADIMAVYGAYRYTYNNSTSSASDRLEVGAKISL